MKVSVFKNVKESNHVLKNVEFETIINKIQTSNTLKHLTYQYRETKNKTYKESSPCVTFNECFEHTRGCAHPYTPTGLLVVDIDIKEGENDQHTLRDLQYICKELPGCILVSVSISGNGVWCLLRIDSNDIKNAYNTVAYLLDKENVKIDLNACGVGRLRVLAYDPDCYYNPSCDTILHVEDTPRQTTISTPVSNTNNTINCVILSKNPLFTYREIYLDKALNEGYVIDDSKYGKGHFRNWLALLDSFKCLPNGEALAVRLSQTSSQYHLSYNEIAKVYRSLSGRYTFNEMPYKVYLCRKYKCSYAQLEEMLLKEYHLYTEITKENAKEWLASL